MAHVVVENLVKTFRVTEPGAGGWGKLRSAVLPRRREVFALDGASFSLERGELVAYVGPNGAGKSTTIVAGFCIFSGVWILQATTAFWTVQTQELMHVLSYGGAEAASHPVHIYESWMRRLFIGVVPLACVSYFPVLAILGRPDPLGFPGWFPYLAPALGPLFLAASIALWGVGVRRYTSTGS